MSDNSQDIPELIRMPATKVVALLKSRQVSPQELLNALQDRIEKIEPEINALPTLCFDRAQRHATSSDLTDLTLAGLPVAIKDLEDVSGVRTTYGSAVFNDHIPTKSDIQVQHLEKQGGVIYAKSNTPEFGTGANTYNKIFGATRNPWNTQMSTAGSSGGAAAALASGTSWLAQGSDLAGSLRNPASFCGVVGMRPSIGRIATTPSNSVINTLSTSGPMARNIGDLALMFDAMCGHEPGDPLSLPYPTKSFSNAASSPRLPKTIAFSVDLGITPVDPVVRSVIEKTIEIIETSGITVIEASPDFTDLHEIFDTLRAYGYAAGSADLLKNHEDLLHPNVVWNIREGLKLSVNDIVEAESKRLMLVTRVQEFFTRHEILICPATIVPPYPVIQDHVSSCDGQEFDNYYRWLAIAYSFTTALCPALSMPCGFTNTGLPIGLQVVTKTYSEATLLSGAAKLEEILGLNSITPINPITA